ncbi:MAG: hypothetical protein IJC71_06870 [Clostridia bacterium]|nr:hypothetical protein [Clostridia bacterium]
MKKFAEKYAEAILWTAGVLLLAILALSVFLFFSFRADQRMRESSAMLSRAEYESSLENFQKALDSGDDRLIYHCAQKAAETAASAGERNAASVFRYAAGEILRGTEQIPMIRQTVDAFFVNGTMPHQEIRTEEENDDEAKAVVSWRVENAEKCVSRLFGEHNSLRRGAKSRNGELLYSCSNAYAVIDARTGLPVEAAISMPPAEQILGADACVNSALRFLGDFFPDEVAASASVRGISADSVSGTFAVTLTAAGRMMTVSVRRDNGKVVQLTTR